jgi:hypothetical protein
VQLSTYALTLYRKRTVLEEGDEHEIGEPLTLLYKDLCLYVGMADTKAILLGGGMILSSSS